MPRATLPDVFAYELIPHIHQLLLDLHAHPYPTIPSTPDNPKRASVALIIRIQPHYLHWPGKCGEAEDSKSKPTEDRLNSFFSQDWVKHGDPEVLFIKRAANERDHWNGHIAFPGGRRDPEDESDTAAAVREAWEEVGVDLSNETGNAIYCGNLTQTVITATWGSKALMTFCPFVFLLTNPTQPFRLQPTEVASAHWVPLRSLLNPKYQTYWVQDASARSSGQSSWGIQRVLHRMITGRSIFAAIRLFPSESKFATESREYASSRAVANPLGSNITVPLTFARQRIEKIEDSGARLLLWGLTLGVVSDFVDMLPPYDIIRSWAYPSFTRLDLRFWLWLLSYNYRRRSEARLQELEEKMSIPAPEGTQTTTMVDGESRYFGRLRVEARGRRGLLQFDLLPAYFKIIRTAAIVTTFTRIGVCALLGVLLFKRYRG